MATKKSSSSSARQQPSDYLFSLVWMGAVLYGLLFFLRNAFQIRLLAIEGYGRVIHEFDPYFNWRATRYLYENGREKFFKWFDHMVWYPLVRCVNIKSCFCCLLLLKCMLSLNAVSLSNPHTHVHTLIIIHILYIN